MIAMKGNVHRAAISFLWDKVPFMGPSPGGGIFVYSIHKLPVLFSFRSMSRDHPVAVEPFRFSSRQVQVAYEGN
jgi:hypothetical protein